MGCACGYNLDNKVISLEEFNDRMYSSSKSQLNDDLLRVTSISRISSQRSLMLMNMKKVKEMSCSFMQLQRTAVKLVRMQ